MKKLQLYFRYYLKERGCMDYPKVLKLRDPHQLRDPRRKRESRWWDAFMTWEREIKPPVTRRDMWVRWDLGVSEWEREGERRAHVWEGQSRLLKSLSFMFLLAVFCWLVPRTPLSNIDTLDIQKIKSASMKTVKLEEWQFKIKSRLLTHY